MNNHSLFFFVVPRKFSLKLLQWLGQWGRSFASWFFVLTAGKRHICASISENSWRLVEVFSFFFCYFSNTSLFLKLLQFPCSHQSKTYLVSQSCCIEINMLSWWLHLLQCTGSPVLGYLAAGILIGPYGLSIIRNVHATKAIAEFGVVFLLFNIGLEVLFDIYVCCTFAFDMCLVEDQIVCFLLIWKLSVERLSSMKKYVFGLGSAQVIWLDPHISFHIIYPSSVSKVPNLHFFL